MFAAIRLAEDGVTCEDLRVAVGAAAEVPCRYPEVETLARGQRLDPDLIQAIAKHRGRLDERYCHGTHGTRQGAPQSDDC